MRRDIGLTRSVKFQITIKKLNMLFFMAD